MKVGSILERYPHHGNLQSAKSDGHCESHGIDTHELVFDIPLSCLNFNA